MLDILLLRDAAGAEKVRESQRRRFAKVELVDEVIELDTKWRTRRNDLDNLNRRLNEISKAVGQKKKAGENADAEIQSSKDLKADIEQTERDVAALETERDAKLSTIGNLVFDDVPISNNEIDNKIERTWGECTKPVPEPLYHHAVMHRLDMVDLTRGQKVVGNRGYFLKGVGVLFNQALINYGIAFLGARGYTPLQTPFFMNRDLMAKTAQLADFDDALYKVGGAGEEEKFLIATSEQPISAYYAGEWMQPEELPIRFAGYSTCFRKEAGSHGRDTLGIFRIHQFEKIEQFVITDPAESCNEHNAMTDIAEAYLQSLGLPYRVVNIVSGELNNAAAKKLDIEAWFPRAAEYRELVSSSNCTDYQSRSLEVRFGQKKQGEREKKYVHMLNATLCATERTLCCIVENYQTETGVNVPKVLQPFMGGLEFIPYVRDAPVEAEKKPAAAGGKGKAAAETSTSA